MKKFHIVGAFDRHNYGDILFPLIHTRFIQSRLTGAYDIKYYAITESNLTQCGGVKTHSIKNLLKSDLQSDDRIIMSGGDILAVDWPVMIGHVSTPAIHFLLRVLNKCFPFSIFNGVIKRICGYTNDFPYVISNSVTNGKVYYTCVGGSGFRPKQDKVHLQPVCDELKRTERVSVRDKDTKASLEKYGVECELTPDSALIMSDLYPKSELGKRDWYYKVEKTANFSLESYLIFQAGKMYIDGHINQIIEQLSEIQKATGLSILLLPIGRATGHEDDVVLRKVYNGLQEKSCGVGIQNSEHVLDIMASLAFSKIYIGTSLHGAISSYSFGNKVCGFSTKRVKKLGSFLNTWMNEGDYITAVGINFLADFLKMTNTGTSIKYFDDLVNQKQMIYEDLGNYL